MGKPAGIIKFLLIQFLILSVLIFLAISVIELHHWFKFTIKLPPNDNRTVTWGHKIEKNRWGFRERDFDAATLCQPDRFVILVLGDSLTWGIGLSEKQRYTNLLEEFLQQEYRNKKITSFNFGAMAASTAKERDVLRSFYKEIKPKLVIVGFCSNDPMEGERNYSKERVFYFSKITHFLSFLRRHRMPASAQLLSQAYENILIALKKIPDYEDILNRAYDEQSAEWREFTKSLKDIAAMTEEVTSNPPIFISLNQGTSARDPTDYSNPDTDLKRRLELFHQAERAASQAGFISVNCEEEFKKLKNHIMAVVVGEDGHPTPEMNRIYAEKLLSVIKTNKLLEK